MKKFLRTEKTRIIAGNNKPIILKGVNFGGWLMMEAYILHSPNFPEQSFRKGFAKKLGHRALNTFDKSFRGNFIREKDFKRIAQLGFNCIRVPFHYRLVEKAPYQYDAEGVRMLDRVVHLGQKYKIWIILDLHAAAGSQNHDWHSDSLGKARLWTKKTYQHRTFALWEYLADRYKNKEYMAGYDLLNESVIDNTKILNRFYKQLMKTIRAVDRNHILFVEGNKWSTDLDCLDEINDDNHVLSIHNYEPLDFVFNFVPYLSYPPRLDDSGKILSKVKAKVWDKSAIRRHLLTYHKISQRRSVPIFVGEFGVNYRQGLYGEHKWLDDTLKCFKDFGFHWTYWTYKAVKNSAFPDGIFSYVENPPWVNRSGPLTGWDTYATHWPARHREMIRSWHTDRFQENPHILKVLTKYAK